MVPVKYSQKYLLSRYLASRPNVASRLIYLFDRPYSAEFYSSGDTIKAITFAQINAFLGDSVQDFFAIKRSDLHGLLQKFNKKLIILGTYDDFILLEEP